MKRIHIIGRKNSGKTTLVTDLVETYRRQNLCVGTIKHTHHRHELDTPGKDSHKHRMAGASAIGILSPGMSAIFWPAGPEEDASNRYEQMLAGMQACDLVIVEGHVDTTAPKIEVWRAASEQAPLVDDTPGILAIITDDETSTEVPVWPRYDLPNIAAKILDLLQIKIPSSE